LAIVLRWAYCSAITSLLAPSAVLKPFHNIRRGILLGRPKPGDGVDQSIKESIATPASFRVRLGVPSLKEIGRSIGSFLQERLHMTAWGPFFIIFV
jgi:hypothetical protein